MYKVKDDGMGTKGNSQHDFPTTKGKGGHLPPKAVASFGDEVTPAKRRNKRKSPQADSDANDVDFQDTAWANTKGKK